MVDVDDGTHRALDAAHQLVGRGGRLGGEGPGGVEQLVVVDTAPHQPGPFGALPVDGLAHEHHGGGRLVADGPFQHPRVAAAGVESEVHEAGDELGPFARQPQVAHHCQVHARAHGRAVDRRDRRQG